MSRSTRRRTSRALAVVVLVTLVAGVAFAVRKLTRSTEDSSANGQALAAGMTVAGSPADSPLQNGVGAKSNDMMPLLAAAGATDKPLITTETPLARSQTPATLPAAVPTATATPTPTVTPAAETLAVATPLQLSGNPLIDGQARLDAGDVVGARKIYSEALVSGRFSEADAATIKSMLAKINQDAVLGRRVYKDDPLCAQYTVQAGDRLQKLAASNAVTWELLCRINGISDPRRVRAGQTIKIIKGPFHAVVSKSRFTMDLYLGSPGEAGAIYVMSFPVGLGKDDSTPLGTWLVEPHKKLKNPTYFSPRGEGIIEADDPKNPLGEFWIGLTGVDGQAVGKQSYGIHGTIEPDSIGKEASMGCIRLRNEDVAMVFELLVEGKSRVLVKE